MFKNAIVRTPCPRLLEGLTTANLGKPIYSKAISQHLNYINALELCGLKVTILESDNNFPDSTFVEDVAILCEKCVIITNPGAISRKGEQQKVEEVLRKFYKNIEKISDPGTLEGGDIMKVENHFYIGLSNRTNENGASQLIKILEKYGYTGSTVKLNEFLHLKSGINYIGNDIFVATGEFIKHKAFEGKKILKVEKDEEYASNMLNINGKIILPYGFNKTKKMIQEAGFSVIEVDTSEFRKIDGGLSCLSLRF